MPKTFEFTKTKGVSFRAHNAYFIWMEDQKPNSRWSVTWTAIQDTEFSRLAAKARGYYFGHVMEKVLEKHPFNTKETLHFNMKCFLWFKRNPQTGFFVVEPVLSDESELSITERWKFIEKVREFWMDPPSEFKRVVTDEPDPNWKILTEN